MINYKIHDNGWTVIVDNFDLKSATQEDINKVAKLISTNTCIVFKNQSLEIKDEVRVLKMFKTPEPLYSPDDPVFGDYAADPNGDPEGLLVRITGELRNGKPGGAGWNEELMWHCNQPDEETRKPIVWLHAVRGSEGSRTSWNNNMLAYADLDSDVKNKIENLHSIYGNISAPDAIGHDGVQYNTEWNPPLVYTNIANQVGMYFTPLQLQKFVELTQEESDELKDFLFKHILQDKYLYHHDWKDGDVVISEQWLGIHRRWPFERMNERLLHRGVVDFPDQDYIN